MSTNIVTTPQSAFSDGRFVADGFSAHMNFVYDKKLARNGRLSEWDSYVILCDNIVLRLAVGHKGSSGKFSASMLDIQTGEKKNFSQKIFDLHKLRKKMEVNPEKPGTLQWFTKKAKIQFETAQKYRRLTLTQLKGGDIRTEIDVTLTNAVFDKEKAAAAIPFEKNKSWLLSYRENCFVANGYCRIEGMEKEIKDGVAVFNWERNVLPRKYNRVWCGGSTVADGVYFGFNLGLWSDDISHGTENVFFYDNKAYKLDEVHETKTSDGSRFSDDDKNFVFEMQPICNDVVQPRSLFARNTVHTVYGTWKGSVKLPDGTKIKIPPFVAFCEMSSVG